MPRSSISTTPEKILIGGAADVRKGLERARSATTPLVERVSPSICDHRVIQQVPGNRAQTIGRPSRPFWVYEKGLGHWSAVHLPENGPGTSKWDLIDGAGSPGEPVAPLLDSFADPATIIMAVVGAFHPGNWATIRRHVRRVGRAASSARAGHFAVDHMEDQHARTVHAAHGRADAAAPVSG